MDNKIIKNFGLGAETTFSKAWFIRELNLDIQTI